jgi:hypothetical protein
METSTDTITYQQVTVDVPEDRVAEFHAFFARFLAGRPGRGRRGRHGRGGIHGRHGIHGRRCDARRARTVQAQETTPPAGTIEA